MGRYLKFSLFNSLFFREGVYKNQARNNFLRGQFDYRKVKISLVYKII